MGDGGTGTKGEVKILRLDNRIEEGWKSGENSLEAGRQDELCPVNTS